MAELEQPHADTTADFGEELKRARELRGISLKEIADSTKISKRFLEAIERNDLNALPAPVFTRGFVREYARYLGLNADDIVTRYGHALQAHEVATQQKEAAQVDAWNAAAAARQTGPIQLQSDVRRFPVVPLLVTAAVIIALAAVAFLVRRDATPEPTQPAQSAAAVPASPPPAPLATPTTASAQEPEGLLLQLKLVEDSWVSLEVDGESVVNDRLRAGDEKTFEARETVNFKTVGNAAGLDITLNGVKVPPLGETGEVVRNRKFDRAAVESLAQTRTE